jgi:hypothetical protein
MAPGIAAQFSPSLSQRCQTSVYVIGVLPVHEPLEAVSVCPASGVPVMVGVEVFVGATPPTAALTALSAEADPSPLAAVTVTITVFPTSAPLSVYVAAVAPPMLTQLLASAAQRFQR